MTTICHTLWLNECFFRSLNLTSSSNLKKQVIFFLFIKLHGLNFNIFLEPTVSVVASSVTHFSAWAREESFNGDGSAWSWKLSLHDGSHKRLHKGWRQGPPPLHLIQHLQYTRTHLMNVLYYFCANNMIIRDRWVVYLGEQVETAKVTDNTVDLW